MNQPGRPLGSRTKGTTANLRMRRVASFANRVLWHYCMQHMKPKEAEQYRFRDYLAELAEVNAVDGIRAILGLTLAEFEREMLAGKTVRQFVSMARKRAKGCSDARSVLEKKAATA